MDLRYKSYSTIFTVNNNKYPENPKERTDSHPCFASSFPWAEQVNKNRFFKILIYKKDSDYVHYNHYCPFDCKDVYNHIKLAKSVVDFSCKVEEEKSYYLVYIHFKNANTIQQKYVLTWLRYLYEFPYNYHLLHAKWLKDRFSQFRFESIANLFVTVASCYTGYNDGHSIQMAPPSKLLSRKETKEKCANNKRGINYIYSSHIKENYSYMQRVQETNDWTTEDFEQKMEDYLKRYSILKK